MVSRSLLNKVDHKVPIGNITKTIFQACSIATNSTDIYKLKLKIGTYEFEENFRVIDDNKLFDILIGIDSLKKNRFDLHFGNDILYHINHNNQGEELGQLYYDINLPGEDITLDQDKSEKNLGEMNPLLITVTNNNVEQVSESSKGKSQIISEIIGKIPTTVKTLAKGLFKKFKDILVVKTDDLGKTKLLPHRINLESGTVPLKQKPYRLSKLQ